MNNYLNASISHNLNTTKLGWTSFNDNNLSTVQWFYESLEKDLSNDVLIKYKSSSKLSLIAELDPRNSSYGSWKSPIIAFENDGFWFTELVYVSIGMVLMRWEQWWKVATESQIYVHVHYVGFCNCFLLSTYNWRLVVARPHSRRWVDQVVTWRMTWVCCSLHSRISPGWWSPDHGL